jgi:hypothetical protein
MLNQSDLHLSEVKPVEIFKLFGRIMIENNDANESLEKTDKKGQGVAKSLSDAAKTAGKVGAAIAGAATAAFGGIMALANKTAEYADEIDKLSERTGINREELQRWRYAAEQSGADIGKLETGIKTLSNIMDDAINGNKKARDAFRALGISMSELRRMNTEQAFEAIAARLGDMEQGARRNAIGNDLLGRSYTELLPLLNAGSRGMKELKDRADALGLVMSEDAVKANVQFGDTVADIKAAFAAITRDISNSILPMLQRFADWIVENMPSIRDTIIKFITPVIAALKIFGTIIAFVADNIEVFIPIISTLMGLFIGFKFISAIEKVTSTFSNFSKMFGAFNPVALKTTAIILGVVGALIALGLIIAVIIGKSNELNRSIANIGKMTAGINQDIAGSIPRYATGTSYHPGGWAWVGEKGPELVELPAGSKVHSHDKSMMIAQQQREVLQNIYITVQAEDLQAAADVVRLFEDVRQVARQGV